jgi:protein subunit release factor A
MSTKNKQLVFSATKKDFKIRWFSGSGAGGQHRNKHQNCCQITHIESGLSAQSTANRERMPNQKAAFKRLADMLVEHYCGKEDPKRRTSSETIRTYHEPRNQVKDHASGFTQEYTYVVEGGNIGEMIEARMKAILEEITNE